jgi:hypothetical protein
MASKKMHGESKRSIFVFEVLAATHFPERKPEHYVFPAERYGLPVP